MVRRDYDVTDRLRNRRFEAVIDPNQGYQTVMEIPEGCAVAAARLLVDKAFTKQYFMYWFLEDSNAGTYSFKQNDTWYTLNTAGVAELAEGFKAGDSITSNSGTVLNFYRGGTMLPQLSATAAHTGPWISSTPPRRSCGWTLRKTPWAIPSPC